MRAIISKHRLHGARFGDQRGQALGTQEAVLRFQHVRLALHAMQIELRAQHGEQARVVPRLLDEVGRAAPHRLDGELDAAPRGHHDDGHAQTVALDLREQIDALRARGGVARVVHVHQDSVVALTRKTLDELTGRRSAIQLVAFRAQQNLQRIQDGGLIVCDEQTRQLPFLRARTVCGGALPCAAHAGCHSTMAVVLAAGRLRAAASGSGGEPMPMAVRATPACSRRRSAHHRARYQAG